MHLSELSDTPHMMPALRARGTWVSSYYSRISATRCPTGLESISREAAGSHALTCPTFTAGVSPLLLNVKVTFTASKAGNARMSELEQGNIPPGKWRGGAAIPGPGGDWECTCPTLGSFLPFPPLRWESSPLSTCLMPGLTSRLNTWKWGNLAGELSEALC